MAVSSPRPNAAPSVSVLIPTHNRAEFILGAVRSALAQTYSELEVIVGVNGCTDGTAERVRAIADPRLAVHERADTIPMYANFNALVEMAAGDFVLVLSDDDVLHPDAIASLVAALESSRTRIAFGLARVLEQGRHHRLPKAGPHGAIEWSDWIERYLDFGVAVYPCATLLPRDELRALGSYDEKRFGFAADVAAWFRVAQRCGHVAFCPEVVAEYVLHQANETVTSGAVRWVEALDGIGTALRDLHYDDADRRERLMRKFLVYRAENIGRSQVAALARGGLSLGGLRRSLRIVSVETSGVPAWSRIKVFLRLAVRVALQALRNVRRPPSGVQA